MKLIKMLAVRNILGGPVVKTPHFQCREGGLDPWSGNMPHNQKKKKMLAVINLRRGIGMK